jgi:hypothetical protein
MSPRVTIDSLTPVLSGKQFDVQGAILNARRLEGLEATLDVQSTVKLDDY